MVSKHLLLPSLIDVILMLLYTTGIRVSELINIRVRDISLHEPCTLLVHGKGQKSRYVVLTERCKNTRKPLKTLGKPRATWYNTKSQLNSSIIHCRPVMLEMA